MTEKKQENYGDEEFSSFEDVQSNFQGVIADLVNDRSLDSFRNEYQKLYDAFQQSHTNNQNLISKCRELNSEINANSTKVQTALKFSQDDQRTITTLRCDFEKAWRTVEALKARESKSKDIIYALKLELQHLSELAEKQGAMEALTTNPLPEELAKQYKSEIQSQSQQIESLKNQISENSSKKNEISRSIEVIKNEKDELERGIKEATEQLADIDTNSAKLSDSLIEIKQKNRDIITNVEKGTKVVSEREKDIHKISFDLKQLQPSIDDYELTIRYHQGKTAELQKKLDKSRKSNAKIMEQKEELLRRIAEKEESIGELKEELSRQTDLNEKNTILSNDFTLRHKELMDEINEHRHQLTVNRQNVIQISRNFWNRDSDIKSDKRSINTTQQSVIKQESNIQKVKNEGSIARVHKETIQNEVMVNKIDQGSMRQHITQVDADIEELQGGQLYDSTSASQLEYEAQKFKNENRALEKQLQEILAQKQAKEAAIKDLQDHHVVDARKHQTVVTENDKILRDLHFLKLNVTEFKETITKTDDQCMIVHSNMKLTESQNEKLQEEVDNISKQLNESSSKIIEMENNLIKQDFIVSQSVSACTEIKKDMQSMNDSIRLLEEEICKREKEITSLREKSRIYVDRCQIANSHYMGKLTEVQKFEDELRAENDKLSEMLHKKGTLEKLKAEHNRTEKELLITQSRAKMLEEEVNTPISVHRWRLLESANPEKFQCIQMRVTLLDKITTLINKQQRLVASKENVQKNINRKTRIMKNMKDTSHIKELRELDQRLRAKTIQLSTLSDKTQRQKEETDTWRDKVNYKEMLIVQQKEQFFLTKLKDAPVAVPVREPSLKFSKGQAPRTIVPRLKIIEPKPEPPKSTRGSNIRKQVPVVPILPPLFPLKTAR